MEIRVTEEKGGQGRELKVNPISQAGASIIQQLTLIASKSYTWNKTIPVKETQMTPLLINGWAVGSHHRMKVITMKMMGEMEATLSYVLSDECYTYLININKRRRCPELILRISFRLDQGIGNVTQIKTTSFHSCSSHLESVHLSLMVVQLLYLTEPTPTGQHHPL